MACLLCNNKFGKNITEEHHVSYEPELTIILCKFCHKVLHNLSKFSEEERNTINEWINKYGGQWINGKEKYLKSEARKKREKLNYLKNRDKILNQSKTPEASEKRKKHYLENRDFYLAKSKTPEMREYQKLWARNNYEKNKDHIREYRRNWKRMKKSSLKAAIQ